jgi:hypothetical protein
MTVNFNAKNSGKTMLRLYSLKGDVLSSTNIKTTAGTDYSHTFNIAKLPNGFYLVEINANGIVQQTRVAVSR